MTATMIVMLIFAGGVRGGPAVIQGFETMAACEAARPIVEKRTDREWWFWNPVVTSCVKLPK